MTHTKLSALTFEQCLAPGEKNFKMQEDATDCSVIVVGQYSLDRVREKLIKKYGDVDIIIDFTRPYSDFIVIDDEQFKADYDAFIEKKTEQIREWGCN